MFDRRVVRGNTFAALVIPVSKSQVSTNNYKACNPIPPKPKQQLPANAGQD